MTLIVRNREGTTVFSLLGGDENSATFALGWALEQCPTLRSHLLKHVVGEFDDGEAIIELQKHVKDGGYTDIEMRGVNRFHLIVEAKVGWDVPSASQLERYRARMDQGAHKHRRIVSLSAADKAFASKRLPAVIDGVRVVHMSWTDVQRIAAKARAATGNHEQKLWLRQLTEHLQEYVAMDRVNDNQVFVVVLSADAMVPGGTHTWIDVVEKDGFYFHPLGGSWPSQPPNYIAFRYGGKLRSVHHIAATKVLTNLAEQNPLWVETDREHFVYRLGPPMKPMREMNNGNIYPSGRVWCAIDTLLSGQFSTIGEARDETKRRLSGLERLGAIAE